MRTQKADCNNSVLVLIQASVTDIQWPYMKY